MDIKTARAASVNTIFRQRLSKRMLASQYARVCIWLKKYLIYSTFVAYDRPYTSISLNVNLFYNIC